MYKILTAFCLSIIFSVGALAQMQKQTDFGSKRKNPFDNGSKQETETQKQTSPSEDYKKNEFYVGYSNQQVETFGRTTFHGIQGAYTRNVSRWFGVRADVSYVKNNTTLRGSLPNPAGGTFEFQQDFNRSLTQFLGGVQFKDNASVNRFKPFGFALGGVAVSRMSLKNFACNASNCPGNTIFIQDLDLNDNSFAASFGGGLDIKINDKIDFRAIQIDYNPIRLNSQWNNNVRFGIGFVFK